MAALLRKKPLTAKQKLAARRLAAKQAATKKAAARKKALAKKQAAAKAAAAKQAAALASPPAGKPTTLPAAPVTGRVTPTPVAPEPLPTPATTAVPPVIVPTTTTTPPAASTFGVAQAERLLWRAGFGPKPGDAARLAAMGLDAAVASLVHPQGDAKLVGPEPSDGNGGPIAPLDIWGHDCVWWLDRMVRSDQPLVERMTLIWHDWFANSRDKVGSAKLMLDQNALFRRNALGSFADLLGQVTRDPAMLVFLDGIANVVRRPNENYAREVMELFTLGADRGAYTEEDVRDLARALTGYTCDWIDGVGYTNFRVEDDLRDKGTKTVFGHTGAWGIDDGSRLCLEHPLHASFFVTKLWSAFIPTAPDAATLAALSALYVERDHAIAPVVEAILKHPDLYTGPAMVKAPAVLAAGLLRETGRTIDTDAWSWLLLMAGQLLFFPPNVAGWDETRWLDTSSWRGRWYLAAWTMRDRDYDPWDSAHPYSTTETPGEAVAKALGFLGNPTLTPELLAGVTAFATTSVPDTLQPWNLGPYRAQRQNALRMLIATCSDHQAS